MVKDSRYDPKVRHLFKNLAKPDPANVGVADEKDGELDAAVGYRFKNLKIK